MGSPRILAVLASMAMAFALIPACAFAVEGSDPVPVDGAQTDSVAAIPHTTDDPTLSNDGAGRGVSAASDDEASAAISEAAGLQATATNAALASASVDATRYSYQVKPLLAPFNNLIYVETDNPEPQSFRLYDKDSVYASGSDGKDPAFELYPHIFADVVYEDESTYRVNGGYIFYNYWCRSDGGTLTLQTKDGSTWVDTDVTVTCSPMETKVDYLIDNYAASKTTFFDKLDAVQSALDELAYYPAAFEDKNKPSSRPYPFLATSPYPELLLNEHYEMYQNADESLLAGALYPFVLDSAGFPATMKAVAQKLDPSCTFSRDLTHEYISVTLDGTTKSYGGAGQGGRNPIYTDRVTRDFTFSGGSGDLALSGSLASIGSRYARYQATAATDAETYKAEISGEQLTRAIGAGSWIRAVREGSGGADDFAYEAYGFDDIPCVLSDGWVDGRYVDDHERFDPTATWADHPTASIVLHNQSYTDYYGAKHQNDIVYQYDSSTDTWRAPYYYTNAWAYPTNIALPSQFVLTRSQVETMVAEGKIDGASTHIPTEYLIYDGTAYPGTPGSSVQTTGISIPSTYTAKPNSFFTVDASVSPSDASYPQRISWASDNTDVAEVWSLTSTATIYTSNEGTAHITATTWDGQYTATMTLTVKRPAAPVSLQGATVSDIPEQRYTGSAITPSVTVTLAGKQLTQDVDYQVEYSNNVYPGEATVTIIGIGSYTGTVSRTFTIADNRVMRLYGDISDDTAASIAGRAFGDEQSSYVVISRDDTYFDALSGAGLAGALNAPILLTGSTELSDSCRSAIEERGAKRAVILGGESAVSAQVANSLRAMGLSVERVYGDDVYGTSMACTKRLLRIDGASTQYAIACNPTTFADAVSISGWAYRNKVPVMLQTWGDTAEERGFDSEARSILKGRQVIVTGGPAAVSDESVSGCNVQRLGGATIYDTSLAIAQWEINHGMGASTVSLASCIYAFNGVDALAASALAGRTGGVVLLVQTNPYYEPYVEASMALNFISDHRNEVENVYVLGGETANAPWLVDDARDALLGARF